MQITILHGNTAPKQRQQQHHEEQCNKTLRINEANKGGMAGGREYFVTTIRVRHQCESNTVCSLLCNTLVWDWRPDVRWMYNAPTGRALQSAGSNKLRETLVAGRRDGDVAGLAKLATCDAPAPTNEATRAATLRREYVTRVEQLPSLASSSTENDASPSRDVTS